MLLVVRRGLGVIVAAVAIAAACSPPPPPVQVPPRQPPSAASLAASDWPSYNRDLGGTRFSPLKQIDTNNVGDLQRAWTYPLGRNDATGGSELTPLVVDNTMFVAAADRVVALRADTGEEIWRHTLVEGSPSRRGVAYWPGELGVKARVFFTAGRRLIALDAATGYRSLFFGKDGEIEMPVVYGAAPTSFENLLFVGSSSPPGGVRAFDARTGAAIWAFDSVPNRGEPGSETWSADALRDRALVLHSPFSFTLDADRALLYASFSSPSPADHYGGARAGDNLYGNSIVALDARTGKRRWHFQTVHHDIWDYDLPAPPTLLDVAIGGASVPVLAQPGRTGYLYILNRVTGAPVFGIEEKPTPQSDVPGEQSSATQPIPAKPLPLARVSFAPEDIVTEADTSAEHAEFCRALAQRSGTLHNAGPFTPYRFRADGKPVTTSVVFPGTIGGASWGGAAADPSAGLVFVNTMDEGSLGWIEAAPEQDGNAANHYRRMSVVGGPRARFWWNDAPADSGGNEQSGSERAWPCQKPPWGQLAAVSLATGDIVWRVPLGITEQLEESKQRTGRLNVGGPIATAGGLVFIGATNDRRMRAFHSRTGAELWSARLELSAHAVPITYLGADGKQYVAIAAAGSGAIDASDAPDAPDAPESQALVTYRLP